MFEVVILEDAPSRLELFKFELLDVSVAMSSGVRSFLELVDQAKRAGTLRLVILDHDLGHSVEGSNRLNWDEDGLCGADAAKNLDVNVPVIVWSANPSGSDKICSILDAKGIKALQLPIYQHKEIAAILRKMFK